jgi:3-oxoacyl-[acyl-carrier protein] reductase
MSPKRVTAIIGASGGIGAAIAIRLAQDSTVALGYYHNASAASSLAETITSAGGSASVHQVSIAEPTSVSAFFSSIMTQHGQLDTIVVASGPTIPIIPVVDVPFSTFHSVIETEVIGAFNVLKSGIQIFRENRYPNENKSILFILTCALSRTLKHDGMSFIPKMAVQGLIKQAVRDIGSEGIRVNGIGTGGFDAGMGDRVDLLDGRVVELLGSVKTPSGRMGTGEEIADAAAFLVGPGSKYVNGQVLGVDGGYSA